MNEKNNMYIARPIFQDKLPPVSNESIKKGKVVARDYRNRRIGDF